MSASLNLTYQGDFRVKNRRRSSDGKSATLSKYIWMHLSSASSTSLTEAPKTAMSRSTQIASQLSPLPYP